MDLNKSRDFFDPNKVNKQCHVIGCGSIGSNVAELLVRYGIKNITLWDMDIVESHNIANQLFTEEHIGKKKTEALAEILYNINPETKNTLTLKGECTSTAILNGYVFMCVDNVEVRKAIVDNNIYNKAIEAVFDFRTTLLQGQCYYADWHKMLDKKSLQTSLDFSHDEAKENTPVSACGFELSVSPVVRMTAQMGIVNFTNLINTQEVKHLFICEPYSYFFEAM